MRKLAVRTLIAIGVLLTGLVLLFTTAVLWPLAEPAANEIEPRLLIKNVSIIDVETGKVLGDQEILIEDGIIVATGKSVSTEDATVLDGQGHYAIPGLFDMHVHNAKMAPALTHPLFIAAGVTAVRDMGGCLGKDDAWFACADDKRHWNRSAAEGAMVSPRFDQVTGLAIDGGNAIPGGFDIALGAPDPKGARHRVAFDKARGIDFLKTYTLLPKDSFLALAAAAREADMMIAGHLPAAVGALEAVAAGQRSFEHAFLFITECYSGMDELHASGNGIDMFKPEMRLEMIEGHDPDRCARLHEAMVAADVAFVPTHTTRKLDAFSRDAAYLGDARLAYIPAPLRTMWKQDADGMAQKAGDGGQQSYQAFYEFGIEQTGLAHKAGVTVLIGTDAPDSFAFPGSGVHDEFEHLALAGLTPLDTLRAATLKPARFLGLEGKAGVIKPGARADIVLLAENPLESVTAIRSVEAVVLAGALYQRSDLDRMLEGVASNADHWAIWPKFAWWIINSPIMLKQFAD